MKKLFGILAACLCMACTVKPVGEIEEFENVVLNFSSYSMEAMTKANLHAFGAMIQKTSKMHRPALSFKLWHLLNTLRFKFLKFH